jgi:hypothetical protein
MTDRPRCSRLERVRVAAAATVAVVFGILLQPLEGGHTRGFTYTIGQPGAAPRSVIPLQGVAEVEAFYGHPGGASRSNTGLEQSDTSLLFLYEDPQGRVSLVMIHDANDGSGGAAVFDLAGIPEGTEFVVKDDESDGPYAITLPGGTASVSWRWSDINTDGGALSGSLEQRAWTITITPQFPSSGGLSPGQITAWKFLTGSLDDPIEIVLDMTKPIVISAIPATLQLVTTARLVTEGQACQVATAYGAVTADLRIVVEGMLEVSGQLLVAPYGEGGTLITLDGDLSAMSTLTFTVTVDSGAPQVVQGVPVQGHFFARAVVTPPTVTFIEGPVIELSGAPFSFQLMGGMVSTGPWTVTALDTRLLGIMFSPDFPQTGWTARIDAESSPSVNFAKVSGCEFVGTGQRETMARSGFVDIKPGSFPNPVNPSSRGVVPVAILGGEAFDVRIIDATTLEIDDDRTPGGGVSPTRVQGSLEDVNGDGFLDLNLKFDTTALKAAGLLGNKRLFVTGAIGDGAAQVLGSDAVCIPSQCTP